MCVVNDKFELQGIITRKDLERVSHDHEHSRKAEKKNKHRRGGDKDSDSVDVDMVVSKSKDPLVKASVTESLSAPLLDDESKSA